jgi:hypothetical protein
MAQKVSHERFFSLLKQMPGAEKESLVLQFSGMHTSSLRELYKRYPEEYKRMLAAMQAEVNKHTQNRTIETKELRSAILHRLQKHGVNTTDWNCVNRFMEQKRIAGKRLYELTNEEMRALIPKLEAILRKDREKCESEQKLSQCN